jgi:hypothetical protein
MHAEWSVDIGPESECLEVPWRSEDGMQRYYDLREQPELLLYIRETHENRELGELLAAINAPEFFLSTAKCDIWSTDTFQEQNEEERELKLMYKFASYVDVVLSDAVSRYTFNSHENFVKTLCELFGHVPEFAARAECVIRRCFFHTDAAKDGSEDGYAVSIYLSGFGNDDLSARKSWVIAMKLLENALRQMNVRATK